MGAPMTNPNLSVVRWIDPDASAASTCSWCQHIDFLHANSGPCLFSRCTCTFFTPAAEPEGQSIG